MNAGVDKGQTGTGLGGDGSRHRESRVVVGVDGSPGSRAALIHALATAARRDAELEIVSTYSADVMWMGVYAADVPDVESVRADTESRTRAFLEEVRADAALSGVPGADAVQVRVVVLSGRPAQALVDRSENADLLVVGSRGRGAVRSALLGSVALHCVTHAQCPVVVVHATPAEPPAVAKVVVGVDGSDRSRAALAAAIEEAERMGAEVEVVGAYALTDYWTDLYAAAVPPIDDIRADLERVADELVREVLAERSTTSDATEPAVRTVVVEGAAADVLVERARAANLLVVGSSGRGAIRGLLVGSVALHCAMHASSPVMVVHPQRGRSAGAGHRSSSAMAGS